MFVQDQSVGFQAVTFKQFTLQAVEGLADCPTLGSDARLERLRHRENLSKENGEVRDGWTTREEVLTINV